MSARGAAVLIAGHGLAGSLLAWACEHAGIDFIVADPGRGDGASHAAAGLVNPITGRRLVPAWGARELLPAARAEYRRIEQALGVPLWGELRVRRLFADERERAAFAEKSARGELAPWAGAADADGFWIEGAGRVDLAALLRHSRGRWQRAGRWHDGAVDLAAEAARRELVIDCTGAAATREPRWAALPWELAKGELLEIAVEGLEPGVVVNRRQWVLPLAAGTACVGATHEPGMADSAPTRRAREILTAAAQGLLGEARSFSVTGQRAGVRVTLPDRRPVAGRHPAAPRLGLVNALGAKGALWGPWLARQWVSHLVDGAAFAPAVGVQRFAASC